MYQDLNENGEIDDSDIFIDNYTTDEEGKIIIEKLKVGKYLIRETKALEGYEILTDIEVIDLNSDKQIEIINKSTKNKIIVKKVDKENKVPLKGAKFEIYKVDEKSNKKINYKNTNINATKVFLDKEITTDKNGNHVLENVVPGEYLIKEVSPPIGFTNNEEVKYSNLPSDKANLTFENDKILSKVTIFKTNEQTGEKLDGGLFVIKDTNSKEIHKFNASKKGEVVNLEYGNYELCELEAPDGYEKSMECEKISIKSGKDLSISFKNKKILGDIKQTGSNIDFRLITVITIILIAVIATRYIVKKV